MARSQARDADVARAPVGGLGGGVRAAALEQPGEIDETPCHERVIRTQRALRGCERLPEQRLGVRHAVELLQRHRGPGDERNEGGIARPERGARDAERRLVQRCGLCVAPLQPVDVGQVEVRRRDRLRARQRRLLAQPQRLLEQRLGVGIAPQVAIQRRQVVHQRHAQRRVVGQLAARDLAAAAEPALGVALVVLGAADLAQVVEVVGDLLGVVAAKRLVGAQRARDQRLGGGVLAELEAQHAELPPAVGHGRITGAEAGDPDRERALREPRGLVLVPLEVAQGGERAEQARDLEVARPQCALLQVERAAEVALRRRPAVVRGQRGEAEPQRVEVRRQGERRQAGAELAQRHPRVGERRGARDAQAVERPGQRGFERLGAGCKARRRVGRRESVAAPAIRRPRVMGRRVP